MAASSVLSTSQNSVGADERGLDGDDTRQIIDQPAKIIQKLLGPVLLAGPDLVFVKGAIRPKQALAVWTWLIRDIDPQLSNYAAMALGPNAPVGTDEKFAALLGELIGSQIKAASASSEANRRLSVQLGGEEVLNTLPSLEVALKNFKLIQQTLHFSKALASISDQGALGLALGSLPSKNADVTQCMAIACVGHMQAPQQLVTGLIGISGGTEPTKIRKAGMGAFVDAILGHAQNEIGIFAEKLVGFADIDLACQVLGRYHRLMRSLHPILEEDRREIWYLGMARLTSNMSDRMRPLIVGVDAEVRRSLRPPRVGPDVVDQEELLRALNNLYLLLSARDSRDTLALNAVIETAWTDTGQTLEILMERMLDQMRTQPYNNLLRDRFNHGVKMCEVRFSKDYSEVMARARDSVMKSATSP